jgi:hypothetical protein
MEQEQEYFDYNEDRYRLSDVSEKAIYLINQINDLSNQEAEAKFKADQANVGIQAFSNLLGKELEDNPQNVAIDKV